MKATVHLKAPGDHLENSSKDLRVAALEAEIAIRIAHAALPPARAHSSDDTVKYSESYALLFALC